jgi:hypothetical protein
VKRATWTSVVLIVLASVRWALAESSNAFSGLPVESKSWSRLCIDQNADYFHRASRGGNPFVGLCPVIREIKSAPKTQACFRECSGALSECITARVAGDLRTTDGCFRYFDGCSLKCGGG